MPSDAYLADLGAILPAVAAACSGLPPERDGVGIGTVPAPSEMSMEALEVWVGGWVGGCDMGGGDEVAHVWGGACIMMCYLLVLLVPINLSGVAASFCTRSVSGT
jgi:hypothetical protein